MPSKLYPGPYRWWWHIRCYRCHKPYQCQSGQSTCGNCDRFLAAEYKRLAGKNLALTILEDLKPPLPLSALQLIKAFAKWPVKHVIRCDSDDSDSDDSKSESDSSD